MNYILLDLIFTEDKLLQHFLKHKPRLRVFSDNDFLSMFAPLVVLSNIVAIHLNATLIGKGHTSYVDDGSFPKIQPLVY